MCRHLQTRPQLAIIETRLELFNQFNRLISADSLQTDQAQALRYLIHGSNEHYESDDPRA